MKAFEIMEDLFSLTSPHDYTNTCDTCKSGDPEREVTKVATCMFATPAVVRAAAEWGADLLITHEPTFYNHMDQKVDEEQSNQKRKLIADTGIVLWRYHDHPHFTKPDVIVEGILNKMQLPADVEWRGELTVTRLRLHTPMTPVEVVRHIEEHLGIKHVRICGVRDVPCEKVTVTVGAIGSLVEQELYREDSEIVLAGEVCEWSFCEYTRDAAQFDRKKSLLILGHVGSERDGMIYTAELVKKRHPELECRYFECGEVYTYTD
ncbi:MAG: Nif3-like dinuclear metal center hexameric protein [Clostridia bacterium]|nr:Nif3-like dinuclear metal center hexameric protein [Clostridia bacterium]